MRKTFNSFEDKIFDITVYVILSIILILTLYPLYFIVIASISNPDAINVGEVVFRPVGINVNGYKMIMKDERIWTGYRNTVIYTFFGTFIGVMTTLLAGYSLSRKDLPGRNIIMGLFVFTMYFGGGLIPTYLVVKSLHLVNNPLVMIIVGTVGVYQIIITRTFFQTTMSQDLLEAAFIDGCKNTRFFFTIALPLSKALVAVIALQYAVGHWNGYFKALIYLNKQEYYPLQLFLREILVRSEIIQQDITDIDSLGKEERVAELIKYGVIIVSSLPILVVYPFLQRYFVKGIMIGSIKG